ncbi:MAG TPA: hypothetical protein DDW52_11810 [Planctomycetaceae bacterium]|nr:hypothetical protein [Planctomycetaceae bacterium]
MTTNPEEIYAATRADLLARQLYNDQTLDRAVLALSGGALGLSVLFVSVVSDVKSVWLLLCAWTLLGSAIVACVSSFHVSQMAIKHQLELADRYYLEGDDTAIDAPNHFATATDFLNRTAGVLCLAGIVPLLVFFAFNV